MAREKGEEIRETGKVTPFIDAEFVRRLYVATQANTTGEATPSTRPTYLLTDPTGRSVNMLFGWAVNQFYKGTYEQFRDADYKRRPGRFLKYYLLPLMAATGSVMLYAALRDELEEEVIGVKSRGVSPWSHEGMMDAIDRVGMLGIGGSVLNQIYNGESSRAWSLENRVLAINTIKTALQLVTQTASTGNVSSYSSFWRPLMQLVGAGGYLQYAQIANHALGLDNAESRYSNRLNARNAIKSAGMELGMDVRRGGAGFLATPVTPHITEMSISAMANSAANFRKAKENAIQAAMADRDIDRDAAEKYVHDRFASNHPFRRTFKATPTSDEMSQIFSRMSSDIRSDTEEAIRLYNHYLNEIGRESFEGKDRSRRKKPASFDELIGYSKPSRSPRKSPAERDVDRQIRESLIGK